MASAGSGKTHKVITESIEKIKEGGKVLVVTFTTNNQKELKHRFSILNGGQSDSFIVKGLYSFYLEDIVRPYQSVFFNNRIEGIFFNESNPHLIPGTARYRIGRAEKNKDDTINSQHFLTGDGKKAHTGFLAKLAARVSQKTNNATSKRINNIYSHIYFDEVQDLAGWDYTVIKQLSEVINSSITCVGDFRQTVYSTTFAKKTPATMDEKIAEFSKMNFKSEYLNINMRSVSQICEFSNMIHADMCNDIASGVEEIPDCFKGHTGIFVVKESDVCDYLDEFNAVVLRWNVRSGNKILPKHAKCYNYGDSKGMGFNRVVIIPTSNILKFILSKEENLLVSEAIRNKFYVAVTRAKYSLAFVIPDKQVHETDFVVWGR